MLRHDYCPVYTGPGSILDRSDYIVAFLLEQLLRHLACIMFGSVFIDDVNTWSLFVIEFILGDERLLGPLYTLPKH